MPLDGNVLRTEARLYRGKQAKARRAADLLGLVRRRFVSREWRWIKGELSDGEGGFCLLGGVIDAAQERLTTLDGVLPYVALAITPWRAGWNSHDGMRQVIYFHNDNSHSLEDVMETLAKAIILAEADAA